LALEQRHAAAAARYQEIARFEALEHHAPGLLEGALVSELPPRQGLDLGLVRSRRCRAPEARQVIAAVHGHHGAAPAGRLEDGLEDPRRDGAIAVVGDQESVDPAPG